MKRNAFLWSAAFILIGLISFYFGGVYGFSAGFAESIGATSPSDATLIAQVLERLHNNEVDSASELLEMQLDSKILEHYVIVAKGNKSIFNVNEPARSYYDVNGVAFKLMKQVASYRTINKSKSGDSETAEMINEAVRYYLQAISKKSFGPISLLEAKFKSSEYVSMPPV